MTVFTAHSATELYQPRQTIRAAAGYPKAGVSKIENSRRFFLCTGGKAFAVARNSFAASSSAPVSRSRSRADPTLMPDTPVPLKVTWHPASFGNRYTRRCR